MRVSKFFKKNVQILVIGLTIMFVLSLLFPITENKENYIHSFIASITWITASILGGFGSFIAILKVFSGSKDSYIFMPSAVLVIGFCFAAYTYKESDLALITGCTYAFMAIVLLFLHVLFPDYMEKISYGGSNF